MTLAVFLRAVALLNGAGPISDPNKPDADPDEPEPPMARFSNWVVGLVKRVVLYFAFVRAKQVSRGGRAGVSDASLVSCITRQASGSCNLRIRGQGLAGGREHQWCCQAKRTTPTKQLLL